MENPAFPRYRVQNVSTKKARYLTQRQISEYFTENNPECHAFEILDALDEDFSVRSLTSAEIFAIQVMDEHVRHR